MILGIGTDIVQVSRFQRWTTYSQEQLTRIYTPEELATCRDEQGTYNIEKLATRFAAKEAFFKALSSALVTLGKTQTKFSLLAIAPAVSVQMGTWNVPKFSINLEMLEKIISVNLSDIAVDLSISHEKSHAIAFVIIWK
ncbi:MAG: holo-ACP synthase [bacterium]